jgi:Predicted dehydrogenase
MQYKATSTSVTHTKGGGVVETADHNVLVGPNALETPYREDVSTDSESIKRIFEKQTIIADKMKMGDIITYFAGVRAPTYEEDFVVRKGIFTKNIIEVAGIQSPGLTAAPAIAIDVAKWAVEMLGGEGVVKINKSFNPVRQCAVPHLADMTEAERNDLISKNPDYGEIVCRCEEVSKGEIIDAINSPVPVYTVDAIKRRVRPGMGRCQGGFCGPLVLKILAEQKGCSVEDIQKAGDGSTILFDKTKGGITL